MSLKFEATLNRSAFVLREQVELTLRATNEGRKAAPVDIPDPRRGGDELLFRLKIPGDTERVFTAGQALAIPGVKRPAMPAIIPPNAPVDLKFDLAALTQLEQPGNYTLVLEFAWAPDEKWRSPQLPFEIKQPAGTSLAACPHDAAKLGQYWLLRGEKDDTKTAVLVAELNIIDGKINLDRATRIAEIPAGAVPVMSTSPAGEGDLSQWVFWLKEKHINGLFLEHPADPVIDLAPIPVEVPNPRLVGPVLSAVPPDEGPPACGIGILSGPAPAQFTLIDINPEGQATPRPPISLPGTVVGAWATSDAKKRTFVFAVKSGDGIQVVAVSGAWGRPCGAPVTWLECEGEFLAGDIRSDDSGIVHVALLAKQGLAWSRMTFAEPKPGEQAVPDASTITRGPAAEPVALRLDAEAAAHLLHINDGHLCYVPPGETGTASRIPEVAPKGRFVDLITRPGPPALVLYYHNEKGPTLAEV